MCAKLDQNTLNGFLSIVFIGLFPNLSITTLTFTSNPENSLNINNTSTCPKFYLYKVQKVISAFFLHCDLNLSPLTFKMNTVKSFIFVGLKFRGFQISDKLMGI